MCFLVDGIGPEMKEVARRRCLKVFRLDGVAPHLTTNKSGKTVGINIL